MVPRFMRATAEGTYLDGGVTGQFVEVGKADRKIAASLSEPNAEGASWEKATVAAGNTTTAEKSVVKGIDERTLTTRILSTIAFFRHREGVFNQRLHHHWLEKLRTVLALRGGGTVRSGVLLPSIDG